jgi:hypothetical protein
MDQNKEVPGWLAGIVINLAMNPTHHLGRGGSRSRIVAQRSRPGFFERVGCKAVLSVLGILKCGSSSSLTNLANRLVAVVTRCTQRRVHERQDLPFRQGLQRCTPIVRKPLR